MTLGFVLLAGGLAVLIAGIKGVSVADVFKGALGPDNPIFTRGLVGGPGGDEPGDSVNAGTGDIDYSGGALSIVQSASAIASQFGTTVVSTHRPGDRTTTGNASDHSQRNSTQAADDIGVEGVDALKGPPPKELDKAMVAIAKAFGFSYKSGRPIVKNVNKNGFRIQFIWRVPSYGGHMGHIHVGAKRIAGARSKSRRGAHRQRAVR